MKAFIVAGTIILFIIMFGIVIPKSRATDYQAWGILRPDTSGNWYLLNNATHEPYNIDTVSQTTSYIHVDLIGSMSQVSWSAITVDDYLAASHITCGASVGLDFVRIYCADNNGNINPASITNTGAALWIYVQGI